MKYDVNKIYIKAIPRDLAKRTIKKHHYMKTFPSGAKLFIGIFHEGVQVLMGCAVFGASTGTASKTKLFARYGVELNENEILEMQRLWIDDFMGHNAESKTLSIIMKNIKKFNPHIKVVWTYSGGCKNDCGIVYQSSGFMFIGSEDCNDFYLTKKGEYKNVINILRFGKASHLDTLQEKCEYLYGEGKLLETKRYYYFYPIEKGVRRKMRKHVKPFEKDSEHFRKGQTWVS